LGACVAFGAAASLLGPGQHGSTFGGNPISCAAALAVLQTVEDEGLLVRATVLGEAIRAGVANLRHPLVASVRGSGLLLGIVLAEPVAKEAEAAMRTRGVLVNAVQPAVLRLAPPLVLSDADVADLLDRLPDALDAVLAGKVSGKAAGVPA